MVRLLRDDALDVIDARRRADVLLDAPRERLLDVLRAEARRERADDEHGRRELGERVDAHARRDDDREDDERDREHQDRDRVAEREAGHGFPPRRRVAVDGASSDGAGASVCHRGTMTRSPSSGARALR